MVDAWDRMVRFSQQLPRCVLHGDVHLGNLYTEQDGSPGFFDTLASRGPGMLEVSYHMSAAVDQADRPRWEGALVKVYLARSPSRVSSRRHSATRCSTTMSTPC